jgi:lipopolysaccharide export system permease protein
LPTIGNISRVPVSFQGDQVRMPIIDRYIVVSFIKVFVICFLSFAGLFVVIDAFTNLDEFLLLSRASSIIQVILEYYGPRILQFFDRTAAFMSLIAAVFCLAMMQRTNELTAIQAGGISHRRIVRPVLYTTIAVLVLAAVSREVIIPQFRNTLVMNAQDFAAGIGRSPGITVDQETGIVIRGQEVMPVKQRITMPEFTTPAEWGIEGNKLVAESGTWLPGDGKRPAGYVLDKSASAAALSQDVQSAEGVGVVLVSAENSWLKPGQLFIPSQVDTVQLAYAAQLARNASLPAMIREFRRPGSGLTNRLRVDIHSRIVQPFFELSILMIGLPLVIARGERNLFLSAGMCMLVVTLMSLVMIASQSLGVSRIINPPALAAWLPVIVFFPVAWVAFGWLGR